jgi:aromatic-L-amino-acid decarboxylase
VATEVDKRSETREGLRAAADHAAGHLDALTDRPVWRAMPQQVRSALTDAPLPEHGLALADLLESASRDMLAYPMGNGHPAFFGWVNAAPHPAALAAGLLAAASNPSTAGGDHADVPVERAVVRWLAELVGFPHEPGAGLLTSGASMATIVAVGAARHRALQRVGWDVRENGLSGAPALTAYATAEAHSCVRKAIELLGIGTRALHTVPDDGGRMDVEALRELIAQDRAAGQLPFLVIGSAGTVNTGAIDPLDAIADVCADADRAPDDGGGGGGHEGHSALWFHVDGAYGAFGVLDPALTPRYAGMARADSLALDPHKWLQVPVGVGALLVRDRAQLRAAYSLVPAYLRDDSGDPLGWYSEYGIEQSRPFRALPVWASIAARGRAGLVRDLTTCTSAARRLADLVEQAGDLEACAPVEVSIAAFRYAPPGVEAALLDRVNAALPAAIQERGAAFVTGSVYQDRPILRACVINPASEDVHLRLLVDEARAAGARLLAEARAEASAKEQAEAHSGPGPGSASEAAG